MLDNDLKSQLKTYLGHLKQPIELVASLDDGAKAREMQTLLQEIAELSDKITLREDDSAEVRKPSFAINRVGTDIGVRFAAIPLGHEFTSLVLALLQVGGHPIKLEADVIDRIAALDGRYEVEIYMSLSCQNCPDVVQALNAMAVINPRFRVTTIDGALFQDEVATRSIMAVPTVFLNGEVFFQGRSSAEEILARLDTGSAERDAARLSEKAPFDVLVVGGGPAGAAAAVYAARKGIRTGVVAERFGGQVLDTMSIENYISVLETEGPKFAQALEQHVRAYDVDIMNLQRVTGIARDEAANMVTVTLANGATLKSRTVILATGARWRSLNVPGEQEYRNRGVTFCPHCDGPLFKGKPVAVVGGGNSGVEAAIDLAGIVDHVTLFEFMPELRADAVLQRKLESLPNVKILKNVQVTGILADGDKVGAVTYKDRATDTLHQEALAGVFIQIGLMPNTDFLKGAVNLSRTGEIEVDARGQTSMPGVFAAGDATTTPYKQIVIAAGEGAKAALSAFDYLIRS
ncbi:MAG: alkyl hydroperoxide reductase subunit F [Lautropia sp.]|nr:alkyl hydroperoxide reductase subunit F [Lautropia sp.]